MKTIGFIDYYISEWHANNYPAWIKQANEALGYDFEVKYAWAETDVSPVDGRTTDEWCNAFGVERCATIEELCEKSDYICILAPSNPETHLRFAEVALKYGKRTYIDKTFAPDYSTAKKIFDIANEHGTKFFTSSALRYSDELTEYAGKCDVATVLGSGSNFAEYIIHEVEPLVKLVGTGAKRLRVENAADQFNIRVEYGDDRIGNVLFSESWIPYSFLCHVKGGGSSYSGMNSDFFKNLITDILKFYETGELSFDGAETLEVMKLREGAIKGKERDGEWIDLP